MWRGPRKRWAPRSAKDWCGRQASMWPRGPRGRRATCAAIWCSQRRVACRVIFPTPGSCSAIFSPHRLASLLRAFHCAFESEICMSSLVRPFVLLGSFMLLTACVPVGIGAGATGAVMASQDRGLEQGIDDNEISFEINRRLAQKDEELFKRVSTQVRHGRVVLA